MSSSFFREIFSKLRKKPEPNPLVPHHDDLRLVRRLRARMLPRVEQVRHVRRILDTREKRIIRLCFGVIVLSAMWLGVLGYRHYRIQMPAVGGRYVEGVVGFPQLPNPIFSSASDVDSDIVQLVYSGLMRLDERGRLVPDVAASYDVSPDKKTYTFTLRRDVLWHDGEKLTARDVVYTIDTIQNRSVGSPLEVTFQGIAVSAPDDYTVRFVLKEPYTPFLSALTVGILPEHLWSDVPPERMRLHRYTLQPIGTGPYQFKKLLKDASGYVYQYELMRNAAYYRQSPFIAEFAFQFFSDYDGPAGAIQALREDKINGLSFVPHDLKDRVERKHIALHTLDLPQYTALFLNADHAPALKDDAVRQALDMAVNKERILHEALKDEGVVTMGPILPGFPGYDAAATTTPYSITDANRLLDKNWPRVPGDEYRALRRKELIKAGDSGTASSTTSTMNESSVDAQLEQELNPAQTFYRKGKDGTFLSLTLVTADTPEYRQTAGLVAGFWQEIGVKTDVRRVDPKDISRLVLKNREYDVLLYGLIVGSDPDQFPFWHSSQVDYPGLNLSRYVNKNLDALLVKGRTTTDPEELKTVSAKIQETILSDRPAIFLFSPTYTYATADTVLGISKTRIFQPSDRFNQVAEWYMETKGQWNFP